jgi:hypothetical protein
MACRYPDPRRGVGVLLVPLAGCALYAQTTYQEWRSQNPYFEGGSGTVQNRNGIDVWTSGVPDRPFEVLGVINAAQTNDYNALAIVARANQDQQILKMAKEHGGDALVWLSSDTQVTGYTTTAQGSAQSYGNMAFSNGSATTRANTVSSGVLAVVRYLSDSEIAILEGRQNQERTEVRAEPSPSPGAPSTSEEQPVLSSLWSVAIIANGQTRMTAGMQLLQQGDQVAGKFVLQDGTEGSIAGRIQGGVFEFVVQQPQPCPGTFRGQAAIQEQGTLLAGTYVGQATCVGQVSAEFRAILYQE